MARADRLPLEAKQMLRLASVIGRSFTQPLLLELTGSTPLEMTKTLRRLEDAELIRSAGGASHEFAFVHGLIQEVVYGGLTARERRALHAQAAEALEALFMPHADDYFGVLAYHWGKAENWDLAREYLIDAAARAQSTGVLCEYYQAALETLLRGYTSSSDASGDAQTAEWFLKSVAPFRGAAMLGGIRGALQDFHSRMVEIHGSDSRCTLAAAEMLGGALVEDHMVEEAALLLERTLVAREALGHGEDPSLTQLLIFLALAMSGTGRYEQADGYLARALELQLSTEKRDYDMLARIYANYATLGMPKAAQLEKARGRIQEALSIPELRDSAYRDLLLLNLSDIEMNLGFLTEAEDHARLALEAARGPLGHAWGHWNLGYCLWICRRYDEARMQLLEAIEIFDMLEKPRELGMALSELAECQLRMGDLEAASQSAARSVALLERESGGEYLNLAAACTAMAGIEMARDNLEATDGLLQSAAERLDENTRRVFPTTEVELLCRRAQLRRRQGRGDEAQADLDHALRILADMGGEEHALRKIILDEWERPVAEA